MMSTEEVGNSLHFSDTFGEQINLVLDGEVVSSDNSINDNDSSGSTTITVTSDLSPLHPIMRDASLVSVPSFASVNSAVTGMETLVTSSAPNLNNTSLILSDANGGEGITLCQYIIPEDVLAVNGMEEVVQEVEFKSLTLNSPLASTSSLSGETLQFLTSNEEDDVLFTVIEDNSSVLHLDSSKSILDSVPMQNDLVIEKYYQYGSDVKLVDDTELESIKLKDVDLNSSSIINGLKDEVKMEIDDDIKDSFDSNVFDHRRLPDNQVMEMTSENLESFKSMVSEEGSNYESLSVISDTMNSLSEQENISEENNLYPNIVYIEGGKPVRLKVHKISRSDKSNRLDNGISTPTSDKLYLCNDCDIYFKRKEDFEVHMEEHLVKKQNSCALCNAQFANKSALQMHIKQHFSKTHSCDLCYETFASKGLLRTHKLRKHNSTVSTTTNLPVVTKSNGVSSLGNNTQRAVNTHITMNKPKPTPNLVNNNNIVKNLKCSLCDAVFSTRSAIKQHSTSHHHKPYRCEQCGATFTQNGSLQVHIRRHRGEKPFTCSLCGNSYTRAFSLKVHMKTHTGEKPHMCEFCSSSFITSSHLNVHRRIHTGERPFSCSECSATFITTSHLNVHKKIHLLSSSSPVRCQHCNETFKDATQLRMHRKLQHGHLVANRKRKVNHALGCRCKDCCVKVCAVTTTTFIKDETVNKIIKTQLGN